MGLGRIEQAIGQMGEQGVPPRTTLAIIDAIEAFSIGNVLSELRCRHIPEVAPDVTQRYPALAAALSEPTVSPKEQFDIGLRALIDGFADILATETPHRRSRRPA